MAHFFRWITGLLAGLIIAASAALADSYIVFGDSLSSPSYSWANQINRLEIAYMQVHAQAGRRMVDLDIPRDLVSKDGQRAIVWLGANDAGSGVPIDLFTRYARTHLIFLADRGFAPIVILPPLFPFQNGAAAPYRAALETLAVEFGLQVIDPDFPFDNTQDGLHPTPGGHFWLGAGIANSLGL